MAIHTNPFLEATLPLPPSVNEMYCNVPCIRHDGKESSRRAATPKLTAFHQESLYLLNLACRDWQTIEHIRAIGKAPLKLDILFCFSTLWKRDVDGGVKAVQDVIFYFLAMNDTLVVDLHVKKRANREHPCCKIRLSMTEIGDEEW